MSSAAAEPALEIRGVAKRFGEVVALDGVDLTVRPGSVHALLGENGAGKSTLMRITYGMLEADDGTVTLFGRPGAKTVSDAIRSGVGMVHQHLSLVPNLTAAENLALGGSGLYRPAEASALTTRVSLESGLAVNPHARVSDLSIVEQQRLEILKALARGARVLILDEPTAVLAPSESEDLLRWIRNFADRGGSVVLVTHKLKEALSVSDDVTVLRRGRVVYSASAHGESAEELARWMFPDAPAVAAGAAATPGDVAVRVHRLHIRDDRGIDRIRDASFELCRGQIVGVAAVEGSGHRDLLAALSGLRRSTTGRLDLPARIALIPADRTRDAMILDQSLTENVALRGLGERRGLMPWKELAERTARMIEEFAIAAPSPHTRVRQLSGGNQQRLVVARELEGSVDLVIADNPTRGLDLRASTFVHEQLRVAAAEGAAVLFHSSDLDEVLSVASRVLVVFNGAVRECALDRDVIGRAMLGAQAVSA